MLWAVMCCAVLCIFVHNLHKCASSDRMATLVCLNCQIPNDIIIVWSTMSGFSFYYLLYPSEERLNSLLLTLTLPRFIKINFVYFKFVMAAVFSSESKLWIHVKVISIATSAESFHSIPFRSSSLSLSFCLNLRFSFSISFYLCALFNGFINNVS